MRKFTIWIVVIALIFAIFVPVLSVFISSDPITNPTVSGE